MLICIECEFSVAWWEIYTRLQEDRANSNLTASSFSFIGASDPDGVVQQHTVTSIRNNG